MLKKANAEFSFIEICFTDQNDRPIYIEDNLNIALIKIRYSLEINYANYGTRLWLFVICKNIWR